MDGLILICVSLYFILSNNSIKKTYGVSTEMELKDNPNFYRDETAFVKLFNAIMEGDKR